MGTTLRLVAAGLIVACAGWLAGSAPAGAAGLLPPNDPGVNLPLPSCPSSSSSSYVDTPQCVAAYLTAIDAARASEGIGPMNLPSDWYSLTVAEQTFVVTNLERVDRGLPPVLGLVASLDNDAQAGANSNQDPIYGGSPGPAVATATIWSWTETGQANPLVSDFFWMYADGPSWIHRNGILDARCNDSGTQYCVAGAASAATSFGSCTGSCAGLSVAELFVTASGTPPPLVFSWAQAATSSLSAPCLDTPSGTTQGYLLAASDGGIFALGDATFFGSAGALPLHDPVVGIAPTGGGGGYWLVASDGGIFSYGDARFFGSTGGMHLNQPIVGMAASHDGGGYWLVASDGGIFSYGDARFFGSTGGIHLNQPIVGMAATPDGGGYWLVASDGGIFSYGDARFYGSTGAMHLNQPVVGLAASHDGGGYWLVASDGGIFNYGDARFDGSTGAMTLNRPVVGIAPTSDGGGYWLVASDGGIFNYGDAQYEGSTGCLPLNSPVVGAAPQR
ncbi:MAG TPA: hypothetical protein VG244_04940 [Acidimicrobiales bacterium]|nr:hypothetical protein [Acidimicrobiales bacterium]